MWSIDAQKWDVQNFRQGTFVAKLYVGMLFNL